MSHTREFHAGVGQPKGEKAKVEVETVLAGCEPFTSYLYGDIRAILAGVLIGTEVLDAIDVLDRSDRQHSVWY